MKIILASGSKYRHQQLNQLGITFEAFAADVDERRMQGESVEQLPMRLALQKAKVLFEKHPTACVIGADQVCALGDHIYGKPGSVDCARKQLQSFSSKQIEFFTALCVLNPEGEKLLHLDRTTVNFRALTDAEIIRYIDIEQPLACAGSFKVESMGLSLFRSVESKDPSALMGLPLIKLCDFLRQTGVKIP